MYDNEEEVKLILIDGLRLLETVRGRAGVLQKSSEGFELVREIERGSLGHMQANGEAQVHPRSETTRLQSANLLRLSFPWAAAQVSKTLKADSSLQSLHVAGKIQS